MDLYAKYNKPGNDKKPKKNNNKSTVETNIVKTSLRVIPQK